MAHFCKISFFFFLFLNLQRLFTQQLSNEEEGKHSAPRSVLQPYTKQPRRDPWAGTENNTDRFPPASDPAKPTALPPTAQWRGWRLDGSCFSPHHSKDSARACGFPGSRGHALLVKAPSERLPSALRDTLTCALGKGCSRERQTAALSKTWNMRFKFTGSQAELILIIRDQ